MLRETSARLGVSHPPAPHCRPRNRLLASLSHSDWDLVRPLLNPVVLCRRQVLMERNAPVRHAYFIEHGAVSLMARTNADGFVGVGVTDGGGFVGIPVVLGTMHSLLRAVVEVPGEAHRIGAADLRRAMQASPTLQQILFGYVQAVMTQRSQLVLCAKRHSIEQGLARWLLLAHDQLGSERIPITHAVLAHDLGVRRPSITEALARLEKHGAVQIARGAIVIVDPERLEQASCECHRIIRGAFRRFATASPAKSTADGWELGEDEEEG